MTVRMRAFAIIVAAAVFLVLGSPVFAQSLSSGGSTLVFTSLTGGQYGISVTSSETGAVKAVSNQPVGIYVCSTCTDESTDVSPALLSYTSQPVQNNANQVTATATYTSPNGSVFLFTDAYTTTPRGFSMARNVQVTTANSADTGFFTEFHMKFGVQAPVSSYHIFAPAIWYDKNTHASPGAIGTGLTGSNNWFYWNEVRSGMPLVMLQDDASGTALTLVHTAPTPSTDVSEAGASQWETDAGAQYGSLGIEKLPPTGNQQYQTVTAGFVYPANEGDVNYVGGSMNPWVRRTHPVATSTMHSYTIEIRLQVSQASGATSAFAVAMKDAWQTFYPVFVPPIATSINTDTVYQDGINLAETLTAERDGAWGLPFVAYLFNGSYNPTKQISMQMGFTGQQLPLGYELLRYGNVNANQSDQTAGTNIINWWVNNSQQSSGMPNAWYDPGTQMWRNNDCSTPTFLRQVTEGMDGLLRAAQMQNLNGHQQVPWEKFVNSFGEWLVNTQNSDGSFYRAFNTDGSVYTNTDPSCDLNAMGTSKFTTTLAIPFLLDLYWASGQQQFLTAAVSAGDWAYTNIYETGYYVGVVDSPPNVQDRESGRKALTAFLALYDATGDQKWLNAANAAADYFETWMYAQTFPLVNAQMPYIASQEQGFSIIGTGGSAADISLTWAAYDMFRMHLYSDDASKDRLAAAEFFEQNSKLTTQLDSSSYGYAYPGFVGEANDFSSFFDYSTESNPNEPSSTKWLPWMTEAEVEPLQKLLQYFNYTSISSIVANTSPSELQMENSHAHLVKVNWTPPTN